MGCGSCLMKGSLKYVSYTHTDMLTHMHTHLCTLTVFVHNGSEILIYLVDIVVHTQLISLLP